MSLLILGCNESRERALLQLAPTLDRGMAHALVAPDTTVWSCHCRDAGILPTLKAAETLRHVLPTQTEASYAPTRERLRPDVERVERCLKDEYRFDGEWTEYQSWSTRSFKQARDLDSLTTAMVKLGVDTLTTYQDKLPLFREMEAGFRSCSNVPGVVLTLESQAHAYDALKNPAKGLACYRKALAEREAGGRHTMTISLLCTIGYVLGSEGKTDSMLAYYNRALQMAEESRTPVGIHRVSSMFSYYYQRLGQYGSAYETLLRAAQRCREFKGGNDELYSLLKVLRFQARFGIWENMGEPLERVDHLLAESTAKPEGEFYSAVVRERMQVESGLIKGPYLMATGREEAAETFFQSLRSPARRCSDREKFPQLLHAWSTALLDAQKPQEAAALAREGIAYADTATLPAEAVRLNLVLADALCALGDSAGSKQSLERFRTLVNNDESEFRNAWVTHDRILISLALTSGDKAEAARTALKAMTRLERLLSHTDQSVQACLLLDESRPLRESVHSVLSGNPEAGYGFEMAWRSLYRSLGSTGSAHPLVFLDNGGSLIRQCAALGHTVRDRVLKAGAVHAVYFAGSDSLVRWSVSSEGLFREALRPSSEIKQKAAIVTGGLASSDSQTFPKKEAVMAALTDLATLLPATVREANPEGREHLLLVSPDLYLINLPFEAINVDTNGYRPLLESYDVAYLRHAQSQVSPRGFGAGMVVTSPAYPPTLTRRYVSLKPLPYGKQEAALVTAAFPRSMSLSAANATKKALSDNWETSDFIYVAAHFIQDAATPYVSFLPLAAPASAEISDALLEYSEIRKANLSGCSLVVLSGCGTGEAYTNEKGSAPSLGDAFLDTGAHAVVHTRWRVLDNESYDLARTFIAAWAKGESPITALNQAQRGAWRRSGEPSTAWTSYSVTLSEIPSLSVRTNHAKKAD